MGRQAGMIKCTILSYIADMQPIYNIICRNLAADEAFATLEELDGGYDLANVFLVPAIDGDETDEDSDGETGGTVDNLSGNDTEFV